MNFSIFYFKNSRKYLVVFVASFSLMVLEIVAGRILAPYIGVSIFTWTSIIGIVLLGITFGNYAGGIIADRTSSTEMLGYMFLASSFTSLIIPVMLPLLGFLFMVSGLHILITSVALSFFIFFLPAFFLSTISPMVVKLSLSDLSQTGRAVGRIYAWSAVGSIVGTFSAGFLFISFFGTKFIVLSIALLLAFVGLSASWKKVVNGKRFNTFVFLSVTILMASFAIPSICDFESQYYCVRTEKQSFEGLGDVKFLILDNLLHSHVNETHPGHLVYSYEKIFSYVLSYLFSTEEEFSVLNIGGGGYTFPRFLERFYPNGLVDVVEIDPLVTKINYSVFGLDPNTRIKSFNLDGRQFLQKLSRDQKYDLIFLDAFGSYSVPYHLTTVEFNNLVFQHLNSGGYLVTNVVDAGKGGRFVASYVKTMKQTFPYVYLLPGLLNWEEREERMNYVVVAGRAPIEQDRWRASTNPFLISSPNDLGPTLSVMLKYMLSDYKLEEFLSSNKALILSDDYAPVDNLMASIFAERIF